MWETEKDTSHNNGRHDDDHSNGEKPHLKLRPTSLTKYRATSLVRQFTTINTAL